MNNPTLRRPAAVLAAVLVTAALTLSGCGDDEPTASDPGSSQSPSPSPEPSESGAPESEAPESEPTEPDCAQVWVAGATLPKPYRGCFDSEKDAWSEAMIYRCSSGQKLITYGRNFYAVPGEAVIETVKPLARDARFQKALKSCGA